MTPTQQTRRTVLKTVGAGVAGGIAISGSGAADQGRLEQEFAEVRSTTAEYNDPANAYADGYVHVVPGEGVIPLEDVVDDGHAVCGMGFHLLNDDLMGSIDPTEPTVVVYGVDDDGNLILGAVEWIVPKEPDYPENPPDMFEHDDGEEDGGWEEDSPFPGVWSLHAWVHTHNPAGVFNPTNPRQQFHPEDCHPH